MGNYVFDADALVDAVTRDNDREGSKHDMGGDIVPDFVSRGEGYVYDFKDNDIPGATERDRAYWRDVGSMDSYWEAHMDLVSIHPVFNLYNYDWPIYTDYGPYPPAKFVHGVAGRFGEAHNSVVSPGVVISGAHVDQLGAVAALPHPQRHDDRRQRAARRGRGRPARVIRRAIIDKGVVVPEDTPIGVDHDKDRARGFMVTESGLTVIAKFQEVTA